MSSGVIIHLLPLPALLLFFSAGPVNQDMGTLKTGVVRIRNIRNNESSEVGTGFIVKIKKDRLYIVTSSHVVSGNEHPDVYLYDRQQDPLRADVKDIEEDGLKGLALLTLKVKEEMLSGLTEFAVKDTSQLTGGEDVRIIGFPNSTNIWTVTGGTVARLEGRNLVFSGTIHAGNSGGPVILNGKVVGLVTDINVSERLAYAARSESILSYVNGHVKDLIVMSDSAAPTQTVAPRDEFCQTLAKLIDASKGGFYSIVGDPVHDTLEDVFISKIALPGAIRGFVHPSREVYFVLTTAQNKARVESQFYPTVSKVRFCLPQWEEKEEDAYPYRYHNFKQRNGIVTVRVYYNPDVRSFGHRLILDVLAGS